MTDLEGLAKLAAEATPGPWRCAGTPDKPWPVVSADDKERGYQIHNMGRIKVEDPAVWRFMEPTYRADAAYIAAASPDVVLALIRVALAANRVVNEDRTDDEGEVLFMDLIAALADLDR